MKREQRKPTEEEPIILELDDLDIDMLFSVVYRVLKEITYRADPTDEQIEKLNQEVKEIGEKFYPLITEMNPMQGSLLAFFACAIEVLHDELRTQEDTKEKQQEIELLIQAALHHMRPDTIH